MKKYHKIQSIFKRDEKHRFILNDYSQPEFEYLKDTKWIFTEKIDGTNTQIAWNSQKLSFHGKTPEANLSDEILNMFNNQVEKLQKLFKIYFPNITDMTIYGETCGGKIQRRKDTKTYSENPIFVVFDINIHGFWLPYHNIIAICDKLHLTIVPYISIGSLTDMLHIAKKGFFSKIGDFLVEGIVARPILELKTSTNERIITKAKYKDFI
jgi:hypothetical protein